MPTTRKVRTCFGWKTEWCYNFDKITADIVFEGFGAYKRYIGRESGIYYTWKVLVDPSQLIFPGPPGTFSKTSVSEYTDEDKKVISDATVKTLAAQETKAQTKCFPQKLDTYEYPTF